MSKQTAKQKFISSKIKTVMNDGIRGKKVPIKQAIAVAYNYSTRRGITSRAEP